ncbi:MAG: 2-C-methyl-D-erythritol 4-phosphate cytidylyltransferase [Proteobacteria bacterium]|jgi:2-C-methyl-D-erythritol 4-phosphate cytidylyltransferase|nr:2-C-methyl-D-erythritol 4-phosphate cytidylyltransferase [Pseudomonadota bacterium]
MSKCWVVIAAGGSGKRMKRTVPKQYLEISGKTVIEHVMGVFLAHKIISGVVVVTAVDDSRWQKLAPSHPKFLGRVEGGVERSDSVLNGLNALSPHVGPDDWVLVHDAARPCISKELIDRLTKKVMRHPIGGILGLPITDTIKETDHNGGIIKTVSRESMWLAQTPQMFRLQTLRGALNDLNQRGVKVTDEAAAMEFLGMRPLIVEGSETNLKITTPADLPLAEYFLEGQAKEFQQPEKRAVFATKRTKKTESEVIKKTSPKAGRRLMKRPKFLGSE